MGTSNPGLVYTLRLTILCAALRPVTLREEHRHPSIAAYAAGARRTLGIPPPQPDGAVRYRLRQRYRRTTPVGPSR